MKQIFKEITEPKKFIRHLYVAVTYRLVRVVDGWRDRRICGRSLTKQYYSLWEYAPQKILSE